MKKYLIIGLCLMLLGCASTITVKPDGSVVAKDYTVSIRADGTRTYAPNRWFTTGFLNNLFGGLFDTVGKVVPLAAK